MRHFVRLVKRSMAILFVTSVILMLTKPRGSSSESGAFNSVPEGALLQETLTMRAKGPLDAQDPDLLRLLREKYLSPPSLEVPNLMLDKHSKEAKNYNVYRTGFLSWIRINDILKRLFSDQPPGFFLEAGALDGEFISNTLHLERQFGWTGLLIEADPVLYAALPDKHRRSWSSQSCISPNSYSEIRSFESYRPKNQTDFANELLIRSTGNLQGVIAPAAGRMGLKATYSVQCFPLLSYLLTLDKKYIQYVSLDVEGAEADILLKLPWDKVNITVWTIEHRSQNKGFRDYYLEPGGVKSARKQLPNAVASSGGEQMPSNKVQKVVYVTQHDPAGGKDDYFVLFMKEKGYKLYDYWDGDYTFIKADSHICRTHCKVV